MKEYYKDESMTIYQGDALEVLKGMDSESVDMCMCSPPYWGLRCYGHDGQLGWEPTYQEYIDKLVAIFDEIKRVLKDTGTCWVNLGDTYASGNRDGGIVDLSRLNSKEGRNVGSWHIQPNRQGCDVSAKSLIGIPERFCIAMTDAGWIRRNTLIWYKPNCMPSSADDRFTVDFEYLYFFVKKSKYWFEQQFQPQKAISLRRAFSTNNAEIRKGGPDNDSYAIHHKNQDKYHKRLRESIINDNPMGANKRCVWKIPTQSYSDAHFATYPEELVYVPIKAGCPKGGTVLDPFAGSFTTLKVARELGRKGIGIELNEEYIEMGIKRMNLKQNLFQFNTH